MNQPSTDFWIRSSEDGGFLRLSAMVPYWPEHLWAELSVPGFSCRTKVGAHEPRGLRFADLFHDMANEWKGWSGEKVWEFIDGEIKLSATMDSAGHVKIIVTIREAFPSRWSANANLFLESGQLDRLAMEAESFQATLDTGR